MNWHQYIKPDPYATRRIIPGPTTDIHDLRDKYDRKIDESHNEYDRKINELEKRISELERQLNEKP